MPRRYAFRFRQMQREPCATLSRVASLPLLKSLGKSSDVIDRLPDAEALSFR